MQTTKSKSFPAKAHTRENFTYSTFHQNLLQENADKNYALKHLYSVENTKHLLNKWGWATEEIRQGINFITIDVYEKIVYVHIPRIIYKRNQAIKIRGISRFVSKSDYLEILVNRAWSKADPYKLEPSEEWDELVAQGNTGDYYQLQLTVIGVTCTCHAFRGLVKAFEQDAVIAQLLINHEKCQGQIPDKHCFAIWKYLNVETQLQYEYAFLHRKNKYLDFTDYPDTEFLDC